LQQILFGMDARKIPCARGILSMPQKQKAEAKTSLPPRIPGTISLSLCSEHSAGEDYFEDACIPPVLNF